MAWTEEDKARMDEAAVEEIKELEKMLEDPKLRPGIVAMADLYRKYYQAAGYKRVAVYLRTEVR